MTNWRLFRSLDENDENELPNYQLPEIDVDRSVAKAHLNAMNISGSAPVESAGISVRIVDFLDKFANDVPIDFLAQELGRRPEKLMEDLKQLADRGVVRIDLEHQKAGLVREEKKFRLGHLFQTLSGVK